MSYSSVFGSDVFKSSAFKRGCWPLPNDRNFDKSASCSVDSINPVDSPDAVIDLIYALPRKDFDRVRFELGVAGESVPGSIETLTVSDDALDRQVGGDHYKSAPIQPVEFCERNGLSGLESAVVKRIWRHRRGGKGLQDLQKAAHEIELLIQFHYSE